MTNSISTPSTSSALEGTIGLLQSTLPAQQPDSSNGYLDLLGKADALGPHKGQQAFGSRLLPRIYERIWRPLGSRFLFFGGKMNARKERQITLDMLGISLGDRVIDVGCGTGNYTQDFAQAAGDDGLVVGIDASETMLAAAVRRRSAGNVAYVRGDACALPFRDGSFDAACSVGVIHMVEKPLTALGEMVRVLAPGGRLTVVASYAPKDERPGRVLKGLTLFEPDELTNVLKAHGMGDIEQRVVKHGQFVSARKLGN